MHILRFKAQGQALDIVRDGVPLVAGSKGGYLQCQFELDDFWAGCDIVIVSFWMPDNEETAYKYDGEPIPVPDKVAQERMFRVSLMGTKGDRTIVTNKVAVMQKKGR